jgi:carbohydrate kinase (thermoresistant glucokinase family)
VIRAVVIMGPSGNGKSTLGKLLAEQLGWTFIEGDRHHSAENIAKMARGEPLDDADRAPFLDSIAHALAGEPNGAVAACSALKRQYRQRLRAIAGEILFVLPELDRDTLLARMKARTGHFMPPSLLDSQLGALERPGSDELFCCVDGSSSPDELARDLARQLNAAPIHD